MDKERLDFVPRRNAPDIEKLRKMAVTASNVAEAVNSVQEMHLEFPILVIPWGEYSGADFHATNNPDELREAVRIALKDAIHEKKVHIVSADPGEYRTGR